MCPTLRRSETERLFRPAGRRSGRASRPRHPIRRQLGLGAEAERGGEGPGEVRDIAEVDGEGLPMAAVRIGSAVRSGRRVRVKVHGAVSLAWLSGTGGRMRFSPVRSSLTPNILPPGVGHLRGNPAKKFRHNKISRPALPAAGGGVPLEFHFRPGEAGEFAPGAEVDGHGLCGASPDISHPVCSAGFQACCIAGF